MFDSQPKPTQQSTGVWDSLSSQASTATTITGKNSIKFINFRMPENIAVINLKFKQRRQTLEGANGMTNSEDPDQTALVGAV